MTTRLTIALLATLVIPVASADVAWHESLEDACRAAAAGNRPVMVVFSGAGCGPCEQLAEITLTDEAVVRRLAEFDSVHVDAFRHSELATRYLVSFYPTVTFLHADGSVIYDIVGFVTPVEFLGHLQQALDAHTALRRARTAANQAAEEIAPEAALSIARDFAAARQHLQAAEWAARAADADSAPAAVVSEALMIRGDALLEIGEPARAARAFTRHLTLGVATDPWPGRLKLGVAWLESGQNTAGIELLTVVARSKDAPEAARDEARELLRWAGVELE